MNHSSIASIKQLITSHSIPELEEIAEHAIGLKTEKEVIEFIKSKIPKIIFPVYIGSNETVVLFLKSFINSISSMFIF